MGHLRFVRYVFGKTKQAIQRLGISYGKLYQRVEKLAIPLIELVKICCAPSPTAY